MAKPKNDALANQGANMIDMISYLRTCSDPMLEQFELSRLSMSANLVKDLRRIMEQAVNSAAEALLARTLREHRKTLTKDVAQPSFAQELFADLVPMLPEPEPKRPRLPKAKK